MPGITAQIDVPTDRCFTKAWWLRLTRYDDGEMAVQLLDKKKRVLELNEAKLMKNSVEQLAMFFRTPVDIQLELGL